MKVKALFLHFFDLSPHSGISKKILYQLDALRDCAVDVELCYMEIDEDGHQKRVCGKTVLKDFGNGIYAKFMKWFCFDHLTKYILDNEINLIYVRSFYNTNPQLLHMLGKLRKAKVKVVMEFPTYPYDKETKGQPFNYALIFFLNRLFRKMLPLYVDKAVTFTDVEKIHGIPTIRISNGIDFKSIKLKSPKEKGNIINLIAVAEIHYWHGFDRIIAGLGEYYRNNPENKVFLSIVGEGKEADVNPLVEMTKVLNIEKYVRFLGFKHGEELDVLFEQADFGIASLARHRSDIYKIKTLKNREYAARGIPFIYSEIDDDFENMPYIIKADPDDTPISVQKIVDFYYSLNMTPLEIRNTIIETLSWKVQMKHVIDKTFD